METRKNGNGLETFLEHWGFPLNIIPVGLSAWAFWFFRNLSGTQWIVFFAISFTSMLLGSGLIGWAKFPVYRSGRFFTFGAKSIPAHLTAYYRCGWGVFLLGLVLALGLLISRP